MGLRPAVHRSQARCVGPPSPVRRSSAPRTAGRRRPVLEPERPGQALEIGGRRELVTHLVGGGGFRPPHGVEQQSRGVVSLDGRQTRRLVKMLRIPLHKRLTAIRQFRPHHYGRQEDVARAGRQPFGVHVLAAVDQERVLKRLQHIAGHFEVGRVRRDQHHGRLGDGHARRLFPQLGVGSKRLLLNGGAFVARPLLDERGGQLDGNRVASVDENGSALELQLP